MNRSRGLYGQVSLILRQQVVSLWLETIPGQQMIVSIFTNTYVGSQDVSLLGIHKTRLQSDFIDIIYDTIALEDISGK